MVELKIAEYRDLHMQCKMYASKIAIIQLSRCKVLIQGLNLRQLLLQKTMYNFKIIGAGRI